MRLRPLFTGAFGRPINDSGGALRGAAGSAAAQGKGRSAMKSAFWKTDWFFGLMVVAVIALFNQFSNLIANLEQKAYDVGVQTSSRAPSERIAVIAIDDASVNNIGRWPWSRDKHAKMIDLLT